MGQDGEISLGIYGSVRVEGLTLGEAQEAVRRHMGRYLRRTSGVELTLERRERVILVTGQVADPGLKTLEGAADPWLAIQAAGGAAPGADLSRVALYRDGTEITLDIRAYLTRENPEPLPDLLSGDTVFVPAEAGFPAVQGVATPFLGEAALRTKVFVLGAVTNPGVYDRAPGLNPLTALALAGGPAPNADLSNVRVITTTSSQRVNLTAWMEGEADGPEAFPEDGGTILYVPTRSTGTVTDPLTDRVYLMGSVTTTGPFEVDGPTPLFELLGRAGGMGERADLSDVHLIRQRDRYALTARYDLEDYIAHGGGAGMVPVEPGDVVLVGVAPEETAWDVFVGGIRDVALISSAVLVWVSVLRN